jgi:hypothetical protein
VRRTALALTLLLGPWYALPASAADAVETMQCVIDNLGDPGTYCTEEPITPARGRRLVARGLRQAARDIERGYLFFGSIEAQTVVNYFPYLPREK